MILRINNECLIDKIIYTQFYTQFYTQINLQKYYILIIYLYLYMQIIFNLFILYLKI